MKTHTWVIRWDYLKNKSKTKIYFSVNAPFQLLFTDIQGNYAPCSFELRAVELVPNIRDTSIRDWFENDPKLNQLRKEMTTPKLDLELTKKSCVSCINQEKQYKQIQKTDLSKNTKSK